MKSIVLMIIRLYQLVVSPLLLPACRFQPTCSEYMRESIHYKGVIRGMYAGIRRLLRCHPFHEGGFDPVIKNEDANER